MNDWQEQQRRTNEQGAAWLQLQRDEQRRREEEQRRQEDRRRREDEERRRQEDDRRRRSEEQQKQWDEQRKSWSQSSSYESSSSYGSSYSSDAPDVPWSSLNWFEKLLRIPGIIFDLIFFWGIRIPCFLFLLGIIEASIRGLLFTDVEQTPESFITLQLLTYYLQLLKMAYEIVAPAVQQFLELAYQFIQSFLEG